MRAALQLFLGILFIPLLCLAQPDEGFYKKSETKVYFKGFGDYTEKRETMSTATVKFEKTNSDFKGEDFFKNIATKLFIKKGKNGERVDLNKLKVASINFKKKEYSVRDIMPISNYLGSSDTTMAPSSGAPDAREEARKDSTVRIIRQKFEVNNLDGSKKFGKFKCNYGYEILWVTEWEVIATGERGKDSLRTEMWNTDKTSELQKAMDIEKEFSSAHLKALGIDIDQMSNNILGLDWGKVLGSLNKKPSNQKNPDSESVKKLQDFKGYTIYIKGGYFADHPKKEKTNDEDSDSDPDYSDPQNAAGKVAGGFLKKKLFGKKKDDSHKPNLGWESKVTAITPKNLSEKDLAISSDYKLVEKK